MAQKEADGGWGVYNWPKDVEPLGHLWGLALIVSVGSHCKILNRRGIDSDFHISESLWCFGGKCIVGEQDGR